MTERAASLTKRVEFVAKDDAEQIARGVVMVPNKVDLQGDYARPDTIRGFAEQFDALEGTGDAGGGVMHAVWPDDHIELESNLVLDDAAEIGGTDVPAGAWVQDWHFADNELWGLVDDGVLEGYSIGAVDVTWSRAMARDELPEDVDVAADYPTDEPVWELRDGVIREVSAVDIPAVPDAEILATKTDAEKRLADHLGNRDAFIEEALDRGHSEADAERLWDYLNRAMQADGAGEPGKQSLWSRVGKAAVKAMTGAEAEAEAGSDDDDTAGSSEALDRGAGTGEAAGREKEGRTLSRANRESLFATIDASLDVLQDANVEHGMQRFTDRDDVSFDLSEHRAREWTTDDEDEDEDEDAAGEMPEEPFDEFAAGGDTPDSDDTMTDDTTEGEKSLAEQNAEQIADLTDSVKTIADAVADDAGSEKEAEDPDDEAGAEVEASAEDEELTELQRQVKAMNQQLESLAKASGHSQQVDAPDEAEPRDKDRKFSAEWDKTLGLPTADAGGD